MAKLKQVHKRWKNGKDWTRTPLVNWQQALFSDTSLGWRDRSAFMALHKAIKVDKVEFPVLNKLAAEAGMSVTAFRSCTNHLEYAGWVEMSARERNRFDEGGSIVYTLWYTKY